MSKNANPHWGSSLDDFLREEGVYQTARITAIMRVVAWQLAQEMECEVPPEFRLPRVT